MSESYLGKKYSTCWVTSSRWVRTLEALPSPTSSSTSLFNPSRVSITHRWLSFVVSWRCRCVCLLAFSLEAVKLQKTRAGRDVCEYVVKVCVCVYTRGFFCYVGASVVLSAGSCPGGSVGAVWHREQMVNGRVMRSIDFLTQTPGLVHAAVVTHIQMCSLAKCIDFWVRFCTDRKA